VNRYLTQPVYQTSFIAIVLTLSQSRLQAFLSIKSLKSPPKTTKEFKEFQKNGVSEDSERFAAIDVLAFAALCSLDRRGNDRLCPRRRHYRRSLSRRDDLL